MIIITMANARVLVLFLFVNIVVGKRFETRCKLVRELLRVGLPNDVFLGQWACLIEKVSNRNTSAFSETPSRKKYYGLYQIPGRWCKENRRGGDCNIDCNNLLDEDIQDDTICAMKIFHLEGFKYWPKWTIRCKNDDFITQEIYKCPDLSSIRERTGSTGSLRTRRYKRAVFTEKRNRRMLKPPHN